MTTDATHTGRQTLLMSGEDMTLTLDALAGQVLARCGACANLALVGIQRRGASVAARLAERMQARLGHPVPLGSLDITLYRDDWSSAGPKPCVGPTLIRFDVAAKHLLVVDDVLYTGRTVRAALEALSDFGRPSKVELLVLVDRGGRELPIHPDYTGLRREIKPGDRVDVLMHEVDGRDGVYLVS